MPQLSCFKGVGMFSASLALRLGHRPARTSRSMLRPQAHRQQSILLTGHNQTLPLDHWHKVQLEKINRFKTRTRRTSTPDIAHMTEEQVPIVPPNFRFSRRVARARSMMLQAPLSIHPKFFPYLSYIIHTN